MSRPFLPISTRDERSSSGQKNPSSEFGEQKRQYSKRGVISKIACRGCRRRKTKCNSERPICKSCAARSEECIYDFDETDRSLTFLRDNVEHLEEGRNALQSILQTLQSESEDAALNVLRHLRSGTDVTTLAEQISANRGHAEPGSDAGTGGTSGRLNMGISPDSATSY